MNQYHNFDSWMKAQRKRTANRKNEIIEALKNGHKILQQIGNRPPSIWPDCSPFLPQYNTPEYLGNHIAIRESGFGFETRIIK